MTKTWAKAIATLTPWEQQRVRYLMSNVLPLEDDRLLIRRLVDGAAECDRGASVGKSEVESKQEVEQ